MKRKVFSLLAIVIISFCSCTIENDESKTTPEILADGRWYVESINMTSKIGSISVEEVQVKSCESDDYWEFYSDNRLRVSVGLVKCTEEDENYFTSWLLSNNDKTLRVPYNNELENFTITSISEKKMTLFIDKSETLGTKTYSIKGSMTLVKR